MPKQTRYTEIYRNPFAYGPKPRGKPKFGQRVTSLHPKGRRSFDIREPTFFSTPDLERRAVPRSYRPDASILERIFIKELLKRHLQEGSDWGAQVGLDGGRSTPGGLVPDFVYFPPRIAIEVDGYIWHSGIVSALHDDLKESVMKGLGFSEVIHISEQVIVSEILTQTWFRNELGL